VLDGRIYLGGDDGYLRAIGGSPDPTVETQP
jgi:hypothetical protein